MTRRVARPDRPGVRRRPLPALRAGCAHETPLLWHEPTSQWLALSFEHANAVLRDRRLGRLWTDKEPADRFEPFNACTATR